MRLWCLYRTAGGDRRHRLSGQRGAGIFFVARVEYGVALVRLSVESTVFVGEPAA